MEKQIAAESTDRPLIAYKGLDKNLCCRGFQYEIGKTYTHKGATKLCNSGFHACEYPLDAFNYYAPGDGSQYAQVDLSDTTEEKDRDTKRVGNSITIKAMLTIPLLVAAAFEYTLTRCDPAKARHTDTNHSASSATGDHSASSATGDQSASSATGNQSASSATGDHAVAAAFGLNSSAKAGNTGTVIVAWWDNAAKRKRYTIGYVGEGGIEKDVWYRADETGRLVLRELVC